MNYFFVSITTLVWRDKGLPKRSPASSHIPYFIKLILDDAKVSYKTFYD
ncbi:MAG: hypothetical protein V7L29_24270 [Nostoc sp.]